MRGPYIMPDVTPMVDTVGDRVAAQFPSGAMLTVSSTGDVELLADQQRPTFVEVLALAGRLISGGDLRRAAAVMRAEATEWVS